LLRLIPPVHFTELCLLLRGEKLIWQKIESHPVKEKLWEYSFFVDIIGHIEDEQVKSCLQELKKKNNFSENIGFIPEK